MTNLKRQILAATGVVAIFLQVAGPASAASTFEVSNNGRESTSTVVADMNRETTVVQGNTANVLNNVSVSSNTGGNRATDNGGEEVAIETGNATTDVTVRNALNKNVAEVDCCPTGDVDVKVSNNGRNSDNRVDLGLNNSVGLYQTNNADVDNIVNVDSNTGRNRAADNSGDVVIDTGRATTVVDVATAANMNVARVGGERANDSGDIRAWITGNARNSDNTIVLDLDRSVELLQSNNADVRNDVNVDSNTGKNRATDNGGEVLIETGNALTGVMLDTAVNFNIASIDCGCLMGVNAKIGNNGRDSDNLITASLDDTEGVFQTNWAGLDNIATVEGKTGKNRVSDTGFGGEDPAIDTGNSSSVFELRNSGNHNVYGPSWTLPYSDSSVSFTFDVTRVMAMVGLM